MSHRPTQTSLNSTRRRRFLPTALALALLGTAGVAPAKDHVALLGTYTGGDSRGIYSVRLNSETGALSTPELAIELNNPEFLTLHPNGRIVYALTQVDPVEGKGKGAVAALTLDPATARLTLLNVQSTDRGSLTHLAIDATGHIVVAASYGGAYVASFPVGNDGRVGPLATLIPHTGQIGPNQPRQDKPHPHSVTLSPDNRIAFVADLGVDRVYAYQLKHATGAIAPFEPPFATISAGSGPRHTAFSPDGKSFYVLDELDSTVTACTYDGVRGVATPFQRVAALPEDFKGKSTASEIRIHPNGRFVYSANRGHNSLAVFSRNPATGELTRVEITPTGGDTPRNFALTPDGAWLLCAHMASNNLTVFKVSAETGKLTSTSATATVPKAVCVLFLQ
ncbi:MAG: lactonase family protein [Opitutus sp.]